MFELFCFFQNLTKTVTKNTKAINVSIKLSVHEIIFIEYSYSTDLFCSFMIFHHLKILGLILDFLSKSTVIREFFILYFSCVECLVFLCQYIYMQDTETWHIHREDVCKIYESEFSSSLSMIFTLHQEFFKLSVFPRETFN